MNDKCPRCGERMENDGHENLQIIIEPVSGVRKEYDTVKWCPNCGTRARKPNFNEELKDVKTPELVEKLSNLDS